MRNTLPVNLSEDAFEDLVIEYARLRGWLVHVERPGHSAKGWRTAIKGDKGYPDLVAVRDGRVVIAELKSQKGLVSAEQMKWHSELSIALEELYVWRPSDWPHILEVLK